MAPSKKTGGNSRSSAGGARGTTPLPSLQPSARYVPRGVPFRVPAESTFEDTYSGPSGRWSQFDRQTEAYNSVNAGPMGGTPAMPPNWRPGWDGSGSSSSKRPKSGGKKR